MWSGPANSGGTAAAVSDPLATLEEQPPLRQKKKTEALPAEAPNASSVASFVAALSEETEGGALPQPAGLPSRGTTQEETLKSVTRFIEIAGIPRNSRDARECAHNRAGNFADIYKGY